MTTLHTSHLYRSYIALITITALWTTPLVVTVTYADEDVIQVVQIVADDASTSTVSTSIDLPPSISTTSENSTSIVSGTTIDSLPEALSNESSSTPEIVIVDSLTSSSSPYVETFIPLALDATTEASTTEEIKGDIPNGTTTITTGLSVATANILNLVNTTLLNSTGTIVLQNIVNETVGDIDTRTSTTPSGSGECTLLTCNAIDSIQTKIVADANVENTISLQASTGMNEITTRENAIITTGEVYSGLNLVNIANTTLIDSHYLIVSLNSFGNLHGDIVLPSFDTFFGTSSSTGSHDYFLRNVQTDLDATIANVLSIKATTDNNVIDASSSSIQTGDTFSTLSTYNNSNSLQIGGNSLFLLLRTTGTWLGTVLGLPQTTHVTNDGDTHTFTYGESTTSQVSPEVVTLESTSTARITNTISVLAESGDNSIHDTNTATITTGNAYASANIINIANTHILGRNWILAIINILGDFNGNVAFGRPDLWVGEQVSAPPTISNGTDLVYKITITNKGDYVSSHVIATSSYDALHLDITESSEVYIDTSNGDLIFSLGNILPNESKEITFHARVKDSEPGTTITNTTKAFGNEKDNNNKDNTDVAIITTTLPPVIQSGGGYTSTPQVIILTTLRHELPTQSPRNTLQDIVVTRLSTSTTITQGEDSVTQTIYIKNTSHVPVSSVIFNDYLKDDIGHLIKTEPWDLGTILADEEIILTYTITFADETKEGVYLLSSELIKNKGQSIYFNNNGTITYIKHGVKSVLQSAPSIQTPTTFTILKIKKPEDRSTRGKTTTLANAFFETTFAAETNNVSHSSPSQSLPASIQYVFIFLAFSLVRMFRRNIQEPLFP